MQHRPNYILEKSGSNGKPKTDADPANYMQGPYQYDMKQKKALGLHGCRVKIQSHSVRYYVRLSNG